VCYLFNQSSFIGRIFLHSFFDHLFFEYLAFSCHETFVYTSTSFNRVFYRIGTSNSRLWKIWFTIGILVAFGTALTACLTLLILPIKYIYELQHRIPSNRNFINGDSRSLTDSSSDRNDVLEDRDKLLIQPIVRKREFKFQLNKIHIYLDSGC
jgi:hypothetical protein